jgi:cullin-associated NEDD8-dissociated protein 1
MSNKIEELLQQSQSYDQDHRFMAANDLCSELLKPGNNFDSKTVERIIQVFLKQLDDSTADIKGNAIKCLAKVVNKIPESLVGEVCKKLITSITNAQKKEEISNIDIYATCLKTLINEIPENFADIMCKTLANSGLVKRSDILEINEELIELTNHLLKRFTSFLYKNNKIFNKTVLIKDLLDNIKDERVSLRKKASLCLGSLSLILSNKEISEVGDSLASNIIHFANKKEILYYTVGFNSIVKNVGNKLGGDVVTKVLPFILKDIHNRINTDSEDFEFTNELIDYYLSIIDNLVKKCPGETKPFLRDIIDAVYHLISYDPNSAVDDEGDMEIEEGGDDGDDEWDMYDSDDTSWKVRRAAVQVTNTLILVHPQVLRDLAESVFDKLVKRFREREQNVKLDVFNTLTDFLKMIVYVDDRRDADENLEEILERPELTRLKSSFLDFNNKITSMISTLIKVFADKKSTPVLKIAASNLLLRAAKYTPEAVIENIDSVFALIKNIYAQTSNPSELRVNMLKVLRSLSKSQIGRVKPNFQKYFDDIVNLIRSAIQNDYFKLSSEGFRDLSIFYKVLRPTVKDSSNGYNKYIEPLISLVIAKLKETDIDQEIKYAVTLNAVALVSTFGDVLSTNDLLQIFTQLLNKLKSEIKRQQTMKALSKIPTREIKFAQSKEFYQLLGNFLQELYSLLLKQDRTLKISALEVMNMVLGIFKQDLPKEYQRDIVRNISPFIRDEDLYLAQLSIDLLVSIINVYAVSSDEYDEAIRNAIALSKSSLVQGAVIDRLTDLFGVIGRNNLADTNAIVGQLMTDINKNSLVPTARCISAVIQHGGASTYIKKFTSNLVNQKDVLVQQLSLISLSELGRQSDLSSDKTLFESVFNLFNAEDEDTKYYASVALGGICLGNIQYFLPIIIDLLGKKKEYQYLLLNSLKEVITRGSVVVYELLKKENFISFLFNYSETPNENLRQIVAECIGKLAIHDIQAYRNLFLQNLQSPNIHRKNTTAFAFRYLCTKNTSAEDIFPLVDPLFHLVNENDLNVRKSVLGSLNSLAYNIPKALQQVNSFFENALADVCKFKPELVKEIELGPFKYKVDEGLALRNSAFSFIDTALQHLLEKSGIQYVINLVLIGITDPADDIQILSFQILNKISTLAPLRLVSYTEKLVEKFEEVLAKYEKSLGSKQEGERVNDCIRAFLRAVQSLSKIEHVESTPKFKDFLQERILKNEKLKEIYNQIATL